MLLKDIYKPTHTNFNLGSFVQIDASFYILARVKPYSVLLINILTGDAWTEPVTIDGSYNITENDARKIIGNSDYWNCVKIVSKKEAFNFAFTHVADVKYGE